VQLKKYFVFTEYKVNRDTLYTFLFFLFLHKGCRYRRTKEISWRSRQMLHKYHLHKIFLEQGITDFRESKTDIKHFVINVENIDSQLQTVIYFIHVFQFCVKTNLN